MNEIRELTAEIISTGSEIIRGAYPDTNAYRISRRLPEMGVRVLYHAAAGDDKENLKTAILTAWARVTMVIMTGGLGPTEDDLTRFAVSEALQTPLERDRRAENLIREHFSRRKIPMPQGNVIQAMLPRECVPLYNSNGTAPGFIIHDRKNGKALIALPGPCREWTPMFEGAVSEFMKTHFSPKGGIASLTLRTIGVPESRINEQIAPLFGGIKGVTASLLAKPGKVDIGLIARAETQEQAEKRLDRARELTLSLIDKRSLFGENDDSLEGVIARSLIRKNMMIAVAESCTGGLLSKRLTDIPGSSRYFKEGVVAYSNEAKIKYLGVRKKILREYGAVSGETAFEMASGIKTASRADMGIAVTGIAGPSGGSAEKPVGTAYFGLSFPGGATTCRKIFIGDRETIRERCVDFALDLIRKALERNP